MKKIKKLSSVTIALVVVFAVFVNANISAFAWNSITSNYITSIFKVHNVTNNGITPNNIGGVSAGTANNRLFVVKSDTNQTLSTLYYYDNIYNSKYKTEQKAPKRIFFPSGVLGHSNSMTVDDNYIYIATWKKDKTEQKNVIARIARQYISSITDRTVVTITSANSTTDKNKKYGYVTINGTKTKILETYTVKNSDGTDYNHNITQIAKYSYNKTTGITKFIIYYNKGENYRNYAIATLQNNNITTVKNSHFTLNLDFSSGEYYTSQDIFYDSTYGLYLLFWGYSNDDGNGNKCKNYILRYNISTVDSNGNAANSITASKRIEIIGSSSIYNKYELESLAYINRDSNSNMMSKPMFIFSSNNEGAVTSGNVDSIEKVTYTTANQGVADLYASI